MFRQWVNDDMFKECPKVVPYFGHSLTTCWATYAQRMFTEGPTRGQ